MIFHLRLNDNLGGNKAGYNADTFCEKIQYSRFSTHENTRKFEKIDAFGQFNFKWKTLHEMKHDYVDFAKSNAKKGGYA